MQLDHVSPALAALEAISIAAAGALLIAHDLRFSRTGAFSWSAFLAIIVALPAADFASGLVHWAADTWGNEQWPIVGRRFLKPFRVHHVNPQDLARRNFLDCNGDVAMLCLPVLAGAFFIPLDVAIARTAAIFVVAFCAWTLPTNQIHKWAHMTKPPRFAAWLQRTGIILHSRHHHQHHTAPFATDYCIINGWCNPLLARLDFWRRMERAISRVTGLVPREEEHRVIAKAAAHA